MHTIDEVKLTNSLFRILMVPVYKLIQMFNFFAEVLDESGARPGYGSRTKIIGKNGPDPE